MIEERISDALADIRVELFRGNKSASMIDEIAAAYDLKPNVLAARLAKAYGSLEELDSRQNKSLARLQIEARMEKALYAYAESEAGVNIAKWLEERAGRRPSQAEIDLADQLWMQRTLSKLMSQ